ncbi:MAG: BtaA family protein [Sphingomonadales bacterium]|nr:BtaA family protein [Sphingomonadales bacterium]MBD3775342.1 BtaA family protein [Paracoccaceae bacterium]
MATNPAQIIDRSVVRREAKAKDKLLDKAFAFAFKGLVYAQIWEDPVVDMEGLQIRPDSRVVTIASGSCNVLSYLTADPAEIIAVDLNRAHIALGRLKLAAAQHLPSYERFRRFFGDADHKENVALYRTQIAPHLDAESRRYWERRDLSGRRRIAHFTRGIYRQGLLGNFIGLAHLMAKLYRIDLRAILDAPTLEDQRIAFETKLAPVFDRRFIRWLTDQPASLFGLGIPPAQFDHLAGDEKMAEVLRRRLEKLACDFSVSDNYFAWQAFGRGYGKGEHAPVPPYLERRHYEAVRDRANRVSVRRANYTEFLKGEPDASLDRYILLDAQDWMDDTQLTELWCEITRTARPGARVLFRTAAEPSLLPGRVPAALLSRWAYHAELSRDLTRRDRSSIYGGVHLYELCR